VNVDGFNFQTETSQSVRHFYVANQIIGLSVISLGPGPSDRLCCLVNVVSEKGCKTLQHYNITGGCITVYEGMTGYGEGIFIKKHSKDFYINIQRILI
jgi:hypothetical protein